MLEAYEHMPHQEAFLQLTGLFSQDARTQILGFRFVRLAKDGAAECDALHQVTAQLIKVRRASLSTSTDLGVPRVHLSWTEYQRAYLHVLGAAPA